jgi:cytoskeleton protein RodZ
VLHERKARLAEGQAAMSSAEGETASGRGRAPRVGAELRAARQRYGWELGAVAASLRIRASYLEAIEAGRIADLPGNAYALGFLRTYATTLGLDPDEITRRFRAEVAEVNAKTELTFPAPVPERGVPAGAVVLLGLVLAVGAYVAWYRLADRPPASHAVAPVPEKLARLADPAALAPVAPVAPAATPTAAPTPASFAARVTRPAAAPSGVSSATHAAPPATVPAGLPAASAPAGGATPPASSIAAAPAGSVSTSIMSSPGTSSAPTVTQSGTPPGAGLPPPPAPSATGSALAAVSSLAPPAAAAPAPMSPPGSVIIRATAQAWIEVRDATGAVIFTKLMQPGESWTAPREAGLVLTTGNAGGTQLLVDGAPASSLGGPGTVVRDQPLDPGLIKSGALPAQIAAAAASPPSTAASASTPQSTRPAQ